ncbi:MAG TPA: VOC family protein [Casimicrobiaceae bacterium]|nr:VOC family protein [Casimicrobiaceae bacterium]
MALQPYLFFNGNCEEAIKFYEKALGAKVEMMLRYKDSPEPMPPDMAPPGSENKIMHASCKIGDDVLMASDECAGTTKFGGFSLSISARDAADCDRKFNALADGGKVEMPLGKTFWSPRFGMLKDRFGVGWMIGVEH